MVAAVAGMVLLVVRKVQVSKEEEKVRALRVQHLEEERKLRGPVEEIQKPWKRLRRSFAHRTGDQAFSGAVSDGSGRKDARTCLYELRSQLQEYERLRSRAGKAMRQDRNLSGNRTLCLHLEKKREWISEKILQQESASYR